MVSIKFLGLLAVVLTVVLGTGIFVGMQVAGIDSEAASDAPGGESSQSAPSVSTETTPTPQATPAPESESDPVSESEPESVPARSFSEADIGTYVIQYVNEARNESGLQPLRTDGTTAERLQLMAQNHTDSMAATDRLDHKVDGMNSADRYEANGLYQTCEFNVNDNYLETADNNDLEAIGQTVAGQTYTNETGAEQFNGDDAAVARTLVDEWLSDPTDERLLLVPDAGRIGVGVSVDDTGTVYATVNFCS